jgi:hypothetical protein
MEVHLNSLSVRPDRLKDQNFYGWTYSKFKIEAYQEGPLSISFKNKDGQKANDCLNF